MTCYPLKKHNEIFISTFGLQIHGNLDHQLIKAQHFLHIILNLHWNGFITEVLRLAKMVNIGARCKDSSMSKPHCEARSLPYSKNTSVQRTQVNLHAIRVQFHDIKFSRIVSISVTGHLMFTMAHVGERNISHILFKNPPEDFESLNECWCIAEMKTFNYYFFVFFVFFCIFCLFLFFSLFYTSLFTICFSSFIVLIFS